MKYRIQRVRDKKGWGHVLLLVKCVKHFSGRFDFCLHATTISIILASVLHLNILICLWIYFYYYFYLDINKYNLKAY